MPIDNFKEIANQPPGTLRYTGKHKSKKITLEVIEYTQDDFKRYFIDSLDKLPSDSSSLVWLNVTGIHDINLINQIGQMFNIHRMDLEGILNVNERSKIDDNPDYLYSIFKMVYLENDWVNHEHTAIILSGNYLITFQETKGDVFDVVRERLEAAQGQIRSLGADYLYNSLVDNIIDQYYSIINYISDRFNETETSVIIENNKDTKAVYWLRKELLYLKNSLEPIHTSLRNILQNKTDHFAEGTLPYIRDVLDNVTQITEEIMTFREMVNSLYETQMSNASNDMNKIMMTLTIFSAIFIPLSFLTGVFGMNFISVPGLNAQSSFIIFCGGCVLIATGMLTYFKVKKWF